MSRAEQVMEEGRLAALEGQGAHANPYPRYSLEERTWWRGYGQVDSAQWPANTVGRAA